MFVKYAAINSLQTHTKIIQGVFWCFSFYTACFITVLKDIVSALLCVVCACLKVHGVDLES